MKTCKACGAEKELSEFHRDGGSPDGHRPRCKVCVKIYDDTKREERNRRARECYAADPAPKIQKTRQYHLDHPDWARERLRVHHEANREERYTRSKVRGQDPAIAARRREATRRSEQRRRAQKRGLYAELITEEQFAERLFEFGGRCHICDKLLAADLHWDHYKPLAAGGLHVIANLVPACDLCNIRKNACWPFTDEIRERIRTEVLALRKARAEATVRG